MEGAMKYQVCIAYFLLFGLLVCVATAKENCEQCDRLEQENP